MSPRRASDLGGAHRSRVRGRSRRRRRMWPAAPGVAPACSGRPPGGGRRCPGCEGRRPSSAVGRQQAPAAGAAAASKGGVSWRRRSRPCCGCCGRVLDALPCRRGCRGGGAAAGSRASSRAAGCRGAAARDGLGLDFPGAALPPHAIPGGARGSGREALPGAGPAQRRGSRSRSGQQLREGTCRGDGQRVRRRLPPACRGSRRGAGACRPLGAARRVLSRWGGRRGPGLGRSGPRCPRAEWAGSGCGPGPARPAGGLRGSLGPCTTPAIP